VTIKALPWDSHFFGVSVGELIFSEFTTDVERQILDAGNPELLYLRYRGSIEQDLERLQAIADIGVEQVTFERSLASIVPTVPKHTIVEASELSDSLVALSIAAGKHSRFHRDRRLNAFFESFYREWIANSISGAIADKVYVYRYEGVEEGMITVSLKESRCAVVGLLSVSLPMQGKGLAAALLQTAEQWAASSGADRMYITTQMGNEAAVKFYKKAGYSIRDIETIFHFWKEDWNHEDSV
jgi:GNAT superfamily N-acetyltransferase